MISLQDDDIATAEELLGFKYAWRAIYEALPFMAKGTKTTDGCRLYGNENAQAMEDRKHTNERTVYTCLRAAKMTFPVRICKTERRKKHECKVMLSGIDLAAWYQTCQQLCCVIKVYFIRGVAESDVFAHDWNPRRMYDDTSEKDEVNVRINFHVIQHFSGCDSAFDDHFHVPQLSLRTPLQFTQSLVSSTG